MGIFSKNKKEKIYSLEDAMRTLRNPKYNDYTTVPAGNGFKIVREEVASKEIEKYKEEKFRDNISGNGKYKNLNVPNYNNYESAKNYVQQKGWNERD